MKKMFDKKNYFIRIVKVISIMTIMMLTLSNTVLAAGKGENHLSKQSIQLYSNQKERLYLYNSENRKINPLKIVWKSENNKIAKVDKKGRITAKSEGSTEISAYYAGDYYTCEVDVKKPYIEIAGKQCSKITLKVKAEKRIKLVGAEIKSVKSNNKGVVSLKIKKKNNSSGESIVSSLKIVTKKKGKATVTVTDTCGKRYNIKIYAENKHYWDGGDVLVVSDCQTEGVMKYKCKNCGIVKKENTGLGEHEPSEWIQDIRANTEHEGHRYKNCVKCTNIIEEEILPMITEQCTWTLTQHSDVSGAQGMFYTLYNETDGTLIVVDGGREENTQHVREVINNYGGRVDAWFLSHFHSDHIVPFNNIYAEAQGIQIDKIYISPAIYDYDRYVSINPYWEPLEPFTLFAEHAQGDERVVALRKNDSFTIDGLKVKVYSAWSDELLDKGYGDYTNNGGLVFKISGAEDEILFQSDVHGLAINNDLLEEYGESELKAEYIQSAHHGNNSISNSVWDEITDKFVFFDAPEWMVESDSYKFKRLKKYLEDRGIKVTDMSTAPNSYTFR